jgi:hypothetical protein
LSENAEATCDYYRSFHAIYSTVLALFIISRIDRTRRKVIAKLSLMVDQGSN